MLRYKFWDIFQRTDDEDNMLTPKRKIYVNGITFGPGVAFGKGVVFGGIDFTENQGKDIAGEERAGIVIIKGIYRE